MKAAINPDAVSSAVSEAAASKAGAARSCGSHRSNMKASTTGPSRRRGLRG